MATKYRRGKQWWGRVQREGKDIRQPLKTTSASIADRRLREWLNELERVGWGEKATRTFDDMAVKFTKEHLPTIKPSSARRYNVSIDNLTRQMEGKTLHQCAQSALLSEFETMRRGEGASAPTIRRDLACLSSMFSSAVDWEWVDANPVPAYMRRRRKRGLKESAPRRRYLTHEEEAALLANATPEVARAIMVAIDTGLRREEQFSLLHSQIRNNRIELTTGTKNSNAREVPLLERAGTVLGTIPRHFKLPYVFWNERRRDKEGRPVVGRCLTMNKGLKAACRRAKMPPIKWHDLRRTCGCRLLQDHGMSMEDVSKWLGHSSVKVTEKSYAFLEVENLERKLAANGEKAKA